MVAWYVGLAVTYKTYEDITQGQWPYQGLASWVKLERAEAEQNYMAMCFYEQCLCFRHQRQLFVWRKPQRLPCIHQESPPLISFLSYSFDCSILGLSLTKSIRLASNTLWALKLSPCDFSFPSVEWLVPPRLGKAQLWWHCYCSKGTWLPLIIWPLLFRNKQLQ